MSRRGKNRVAPLPNNEGGESRHEVDTRNRGATHIDNVNANNNNDNLTFSHRVRDL